MKMTRTLPTDKRGNVYYGPRTVIATPNNPAGAGSSPSKGSAVDTIRELLLCPDYVSSDEWAYESRQYSDEEWNNAIDAVARQYGRAPDPGWIEKVRAQLGLT